MIDNKIPICVHGHCLITDDTGEVILDKSNAIHPANVARIIARALANESNYWIDRIAFGNSGTVTDSAFNITYKTPNDGLPPDVTGWRSRLYNETYSEVINESSVLISTGVGASPTNDPVAVANSQLGPGVVSVDQGQLSQVVISCVLNPNEPKGQFATDIVGNGSNGIAESTETPFTFDEIGLFTAGAPLAATPGSQAANIGIKTSTDNTSLSPNTTYVFDIGVSGITQSITIHTPASGSGTSGEILYSDLLVLINAVLSGATATISDEIHQTYGYLQFTNNSTGSTASISLSVPSSPPGNWLFDNLGSFIGFETAIVGSAAGVDNDPNHPTKEASRMLTHLIFSPVLKSANRTFIIKYTLTIGVARSVG